MAVLWTGKTSIDLAVLSIESALHHLRMELAQAEAFQSCDLTPEDCEDPELDFWRRCCNTLLDMAEALRPTVNGWPNKQGDAEVVCLETYRRSLP